LLSVGLVCENELSAKAGVALNPVTNGPVVDSRLMTSVPGIFASGNVLHIHDLVDRVVEEASRAGSSCADWLDKVSGKTGSDAELAEIPLRSGLNVRYTVPSSIDPSRTVRLSLRSMVVMDKGTLSLSIGGERVFEKKLSWVKPGEMISVDVPPLNERIPGDGKDKTFEVSLTRSEEASS
jgi:hypothetical protein